MAYLLDHPPRRSQFRAKRREDPSGVVVLHSAENIPDYVAFDGGAEAVAGFIQRRPDPGSYHRLNDSDSAIQMMPWDYEAFQDGTGSNPHAVGLSVATSAAVWPLAPKAWRDGAIEHLARGAADYAAWLHGRSGIVIPAKRISRSESELRLPGFISHGERDPARRTDPGKAFPWAQFLARYAALTDTGDDDMTKEEHDLLIATHALATAAADGVAALKEQVEAIFDRQVPEATVRGDIVLTRTIAAKVGVPATDIED